MSEYNSNVNYLLDYKNRSILEYEKDIRNKCKEYMNSLKDRNDKSLNSKRILLEYEDSIKRLKNKISYDKNNSHYE